MVSCFNQGCKLISRNFSEHSFYRKPLGDLPARDVTHMLLINPTDSASDVFDLNSVHTGRMQ